MKAPTGGGHLTRHSLDTNVCIQYLNYSINQIINRLNALSHDDIFICDIVKYDLDYGAYRSGKVETNLASLAIFFNEFYSLLFDGKAAKNCGFIQQYFHKKGTPLGVYDLQIASIALANDLVLVTHNVSEFSRVEM